MRGEARPEGADGAWVRRLRAAAATGFAGWVLLSLGEAFLDRAAQLTALGAVTIVPLGLALAADPDDRGDSGVTFRAAGALVILGGAAALGSFLLPPGPPAALLAGVWVLGTVAVSIHGLRRLLRRGLGPLEELAIDAGHLYLPVGGIWLFASRAGVPLLGFHEPLVGYTAAHFHFAGFAAPVIAGLLGRALGLQRAPGGPDLREIGPSAASWTGPPRAAIAALYRAAAGVILCGIPLVASGILLSRAIELPAAILLASGMLTCSSLLGWVGARRLRQGPGRARISGIFLLIAGLSLVFSMALAVAFTTTGSATQGAAVPWIPYSRMADLHGVANALGFAFAALVGLTLDPPARRHGAPRGTWPRLLGRGFIGPDFFDRLGAIDPARPVAGQLRSLDDFAHAGFSPATVHDNVRDFYEQTAAYDMAVIPRWYWPFHLPARLYTRVMRRLVGQLELPVDREDAGRIETRLFGLQSAIDGRQDVRGYVRTYRSPDGTEHAIYVAAYSTHQSPTMRLLSAAFPLPFAALVGVLRFEDGPHPGGLVLSSRPAEGEGPGDEGMYLQTPLGPWRVPVDERIAVWATEPGGQLHATHEVRLLGLRCFDLSYEIARKIKHLHSFTARSDAPRCAARRRG
jgi:hypothetical protein